VSPRPNYYKILKVDSKASGAEIMSAYHKMKKTFSKDSVATYSLMGTGDIEMELQEIEEAYRILSNEHKRKEYDEGGSRPANKKKGTKQMKLSELAKVASKAPKEQNQPNGESTQTVEMPTLASEQKALASVSGAELKKVRERGGFKVEEVAQVTKVHRNFIHALEQENFTGLPARVYVQGFIKILAAHYGLNPQDTAVKYMQAYDQQVAKKD